MKCVIRQFSKISIFILFEKRITFKSIVKADDCDLKIDKTSSKRDSAFSAWMLYLRFNKTTSKNPTSPFTKVLIKFQ